MSAIPGDTIASQKRADTDTPLSDEEQHTEAEGAGDAEEAPNKAEISGASRQQAPSSSPSRAQIVAIVFGFSALFFIVLWLCFLLWG